MGYELDDRGIEIRFLGGGVIFLFSTLSRLPSLVYNGYLRLSPWRQSGQGVKLAIHLYLVLRLRVV
jgi:hypothetical protein